MWAVVEIAPVASVEPFGISSRSIGQLRGNRTFVGSVLQQFLVLLAGVLQDEVILLLLHMATLSVSRCHLTSRLLPASPWPLGLTLSSSAPAFLMVVSSLEVYQGTWPGKAVVRWSEHWIWNLEAGIRNLDAGIQRRQSSSVPGPWAGGCLVCLQYFEELLFWLLQLLEFVKVVNPAGRCYTLLEDLVSFSYVAEL
ncbi:hypothetical protein HID58_048317 [Brassica napus]|uniref:Uncharacterized protein n=1 Tax=Brassica napus TaxID=3708 RepID=A0ABQ8B1R4_BRANA|nr:hypothetical protein HID58_048317 [Brassica napus]